VSQLIYTELEGQPLRWEYKGVVPREARQEASREPKTWSVSTTPATQISGMTGTDNDLYGSNMLAQTFRSPTNVLKLTGIQLYGRKVGSPPNPLMVEVRKAKYINAFAVAPRVDFSTGGEKTVLTMNTSLPSGGKNIIICVFMPNAALINNTTEGYLRIYKDSAQLISFYIGKLFSCDKPVMIMAVDESPAGNDTYSFRIHVSSASSGAGAIHVQAMVIKVASVSYHFRTSTISIPSGSTVTVASIDTSFPANSKVVVLATALAAHHDLSGYQSINAGNIRIKRDTTTLSANQFQVGSNYTNDPIKITLAALDAPPSSSQTYSLEITNNSSVAFSCTAQILAFQVDDATFLDTDSVTLTSGTPVTVATLNTSLSGKIGVICLASVENTSSSSATAFNADDVALSVKSTSCKLTNLVGWYLGATSSSARSGTLPLLFLETATNPTYKLEMTSRISGINAEAKILAFKIDNAQTFGEALIEILDDVLASGNIAPASVGTSNAWINITLSGANIIALRPGEYFAVVTYTIGGDASNKYVIQSGDSSILGTLVKSSNSGGSWTYIFNQELGIKIDGVLYSKLYYGSIQNNITTPLGKVLVALIIRAQTSASMEFCGFDDHTLTAPIVTSTATSQTLITVLKPDDPRIRDVEPSNTLNWEIWGAGSGLSTAAYTQRHTYFTKNPVYPADFGFGELYLIADEIPPQGLVVLNDNAAAALFNSSTINTRVDAYEMFRVPVRKIEVVQEPTTGRIVLYLIGLP